MTFFRNIFLFFSFFSFALSAWAASSATVITALRCPLCSVDLPKKKISYYFPEIKFREVDYKSKKGKKLIKEHEVDTLPFFIFDAGLKEKDNFSKISNAFDTRGGQLVLKKKYSGIFLFLDRERKPRRIDYFLDFYHPRAFSVFDGLLNFCRSENISLNINFISPDKVSFGYPRREIKVALAVSSLYPDKFFDYLKERLRYIETVDPASSLRKLNLDLKETDDFIASGEFASILRANEAQAREIGVTNGNVILVNNQWLFMIYNFSGNDLKEMFK